ncbi:MAG: GNAT family N-acetyltransferase [Vibrio sp.]|uniref:GNAT family N-acetyltransferase n=1 Tax=Vibrio sp. TaxID=678 RepID=UPI003A87AE03
MTTIREMDISDYQAVITLWGQTDNLSLRDADSEQNISVYLKRNPGLSYVALDGATVIGAVLVGTDGRRGYLQHLAVDERYRGQKIGQTLVDMSVRALAEFGISKTHLFVLNENHSAKGFYHKLGWCPRSEITMYSYNSSDNLNV